MGLLQNIKTLKQKKPQKADAALFNAVALKPSVPSAASPKLPSAFAPAFAQGLAEGLSGRWYGNPNPDHIEDFSAGQAAGNNNVQEPAAPDPALRQGADDLKAAAAKSQEEAAIAAGRPGWVRQQELEAQDRVEPRAETADAGDSDQDNLAAFSNSEQLGARLIIFLYVRQLFASFFTHTTLPILMPRVAMRFGPCYPSSMFLPFLFTGAIAGFSGVITAQIFSLPTISGTITYLVYTLLTGIIAYRGLYRVTAFLTQRRRDLMLSGICLLIPTLVLINFTNALFAAAFNPLEGAIAFALASMMSAGFASTVAYDVEQDPVDSLGTMTTSGLGITALVLLLSSVLLFNPLVGISLLGVGLFFRVLSSYYLTKHHATASRLYIYALQLVTLLAMLLDLLILARKGYILLPEGLLELLITN